MEAGADDVMHSTQIRARNGLEFGVAVRGGQIGDSHLATHERRNVHETSGGKMEEWPYD